MREEIIAQYIRTVTEKMPKEFQAVEVSCIFLNFIQLSSERVLESPMLLRH